MSLTLQKCDGCGGLTPLEKMEPAELYEQSYPGSRGVQFQRVVYVCPFCTSTANALLSGQPIDWPVPVAVSVPDEAVDPADAATLREGAVEVTETGEVKVLPTTAIEGIVPYTTAGAVGGVPVPAMNATNATTPPILPVPSTTQTQTQ